MNIGYPSINQQQYGDHYPLVNPSSAIAGLIADMSVLYDDPNRDVLAPFLITDIDFSNNRLRIISDTRDTAESYKIIFDSLYFTQGQVQAVANYHDAYQTLQDVYKGMSDKPITCYFYKKDFGDLIYDNITRYTIYYWSTLFCTVKLVVRNQFKDRLVGPLTGLHEQIDPRACTVLSDHVRSLNLTSKCDVVLQAGNNISLTHDNGVVTISAIPGAGLGKIKVACPSTNGNELYTINGIEPTRGNIVLTQLNDGYSLALENYPIMDCSAEGSETKVPCSGIRCANSNLPCCTAEDCETVHTELRTTSDMYYEAGARAEKVRDNYKDMLEDFKNREDCSSPFHIDVRNVYCPYFEVVGQFGNTYDQCVTDVAFDMHFSQNIGVVPNHGVRREMSLKGMSIVPLERADTPSGGSDTVHLAWNSTIIPPGTSVYQQYRVYLVNPNDPGSNHLETTILSYSITLQDGTVITDGVNLQTVLNDMDCPAEIWDNSPSLDEWSCEE